MERQLLTDPQTSGGLLVACAASQGDRILHAIRAAGYAEAGIIGEMSTGSGVAVF